MPTSLQPLPIISSPDELETGHYSAETLFLAVRALHRDGFVVLEDIMKTSLLDGIKSFLLGEGDAIRKPHKAEEDKSTGQDCLSCRSGI